MKKKFLLGIMIGIVACFCLVGCASDDEYSETVAGVEKTEEEFEEQSENEEDVEKTSDDEDESSEDVYEESEPVTDAEQLEADEQNEDVSEAVTMEEEITYPVGEGANISFDTVDIYGNHVDNEMLKDYRLIMLNLWEPWCGPCVNEMPELSELYEDYKDQGLLIVGAYTTFEMDSEAKAIVEKLGISYPIIKCNKSIYTLEQDYVPATFLLDRNGNVITEEPFAGSDSYSGWESVIQEYL